MKGGFQNVRMPVVLERMKQSEIEGRWTGWMKGFFRERIFDIEWDGEKRGQGKTNVGVPQGSTLSSVAFLFFMAPILEEMELTIAEELQLNIEIPSYVDDILICVLDKEGKMEMKKELKEVDVVVNGVAAKWNLPLEKEKHEEIVFNPGGRGSGRKKKRAETEKVKWLGIIIHENLKFDHQWKSRIEKARKLLGALSGFGNSQ